MKNSLKLDTNQSAETERCESIELDDEIRNLIEKTMASQFHEKSVAQGSVLSKRTSCSLKTCSKTDVRGHLLWAETSISSMESSAQQSKCLLLTKKKSTSTDTLEQQIISLERQRQELLEVNKQWDQQFRSMKKQYERKLAEVKAKLDASQKRVRELEEEQHQNQQECEGLRGLVRDGFLQEVALLDALQKQCSSFHVPHLDKSDRNCKHEEMRTQLEVLRQQVQIYEEDFKKERSDRERLNEEKEALQKINERSQSQLRKLNSQIKACLKEKEQLEKQLKHQTKVLAVPTERHCIQPQVFLPPCANYGNCGLCHHYQDPWLHTTVRGIHDQQQHPPDYQWYVPDQFPPDVQHKANDSSSKKEVHH
ncbi:TNFAIP3-interacting protein 3 isoform X2 [Alligator sinensis]|uniref:TNFAIP3-interacting protein 3 isoform X2 n=1 Tax=Alligator sinensis TaxID=38654 RepID=A0A3Q0G5H6_ALLSI|nr:TNFAIP3-interacting protein 3 isoform X2 [Alligator sinensis]